MIFLKSAYLFVGREYGVLMYLSSSGDAIACMVHVQPLVAMGNATFETLIQSL